MFQKNQTTICDHHCTIMYFAETLKDLVNQNQRRKLTKEEFCEKVNTVADGIYKEAQEALDAGKRMENRMKLVNETIKSLGYERVEKKIDK